MNLGKRILSVKGNEYRSALRNGRAFDAIEMIAKDYTSIIDDILQVDGLRDDDVIGTPLEKILKFSVYSMSNYGRDSVYYDFSERDEFYKDNCEKEFNKSKDKTFANIKNRIARSNCEFAHNSFETERKRQQMLRDMEIQHYRRMGYKIVYPVTMREMITRAIIILVFLLIFIAIFNIPFFDNQVHEFFKENIFTEGIYRLLKNIFTFKWLGG